MLVVNEARIESLNGEKHETESFRVHPANTDSKSKKNQMRINTDYKAYSTSSEKQNWNIFIVFG